MHVSIIAVILPSKELGCIVTNQSLEVIYLVAKVAMFTYGVHWTAHLGHYHVPFVIGL